MKQRYSIYYLLFFLATFCSCRKEQTIMVLPDFSYKVVDSNYTVPVKVVFSNTTSGAEKYLWEFEGGVPATSEEKNPGTVLFSEAGEHKVILTAWNEDSRERKEITLKLDSAVNNSFEANILVNAFAPAFVEIINNTTGASSYQWTFEGGFPATSFEKHPGKILFASGGEHLITLVSTNGREQFTTSKKIILLPVLNPSFTLVPSFEDDDMQAPLTATVSNTSLGALSWKWSVQGAEISNDTAKTPSIFFANPGTYTVKLTADNHKETKTVEQIITILGNTNLRTFTNVKLGISMAQNSIGSFFSTTLRKSIRANENLSSIGKEIDIVYFGLNKNFTYNKFISPDSAAFYAFTPIPNASKTIVMNAVASSVMTPQQFDEMNDDKILSAIPITQNFSQFAQTASPQLMLFLTANGRKGAIKIKKYVEDGYQSYILADIKVQKQAK